MRAVACQINIVNFQFELFFLWEKRREEKNVYAYYLIESVNYTKKP